ncbi:atrial natriuretic peptide receptor 1-like [Paramacrobiotus metropolitanus]|uniref:atrial natriuretic peptide receptor 1-like n=1 Tax=Paramacrobiotus metropolitanus TaxID=2943436 RepID=UPI00244588A3|nr:atrial natriuretic peptide receptor 1-like [Paramacrobiotus metropolitanus]
MHKVLVRFLVLLGLQIFSTSCATTRFVAKTLVTRSTAVQLASSSSRPAIINLTRSTAAVTTDATRPTTMNLTRAVNATTTPTPDPVTTTVYSTTYPTTYPTDPPRINPKDKTIRLCVMVEKDPSLYYDYSRAAAAIDMGIEWANQKMLTDGRQIVKLFIDVGGSCVFKNDAVIFQALRLRDQGIVCHAFLGPGCGYNADALYNLIEYTQTPILGCPAAGSTLLADRSDYPLLTRVSFSHRDAVNFMLRFCAANDYTHVVVIVDVTTTFYQQLGTVFQSELKRRRELTGFSMRFIKNDKANRTDFEKILRDVNTTARIYIVCANASVFRLITVHFINLHGTVVQYYITESVYFCVVYVGIELFTSNRWGVFTWRMDDGLDRAAKRSFDSVLFVSLNLPRTSYYDTWSAEVKQRARIDYNYTFAAFEEVDPVVVTFFDAVLVYATAVERILTNPDGNNNILDGQLVSAYLRNMSMESPVSGTVYIDNSGDRVNDFLLKTIDTTGRIVVVYTFRTLTGTLTQIGSAMWPTPDGNLPPDSPPCGFTGDAVACQPPARMSTATLAVAVVIPLVAAGITCVVIGCCISRWLRNQALDPNWWRVPHAELEITGGNMNKSSQGSRLGNRKTVADDTGSQVTRQTDGTANSTGISGMVGRTATLKGNLISVTDVTDKKRKPNSILIREMNAVRITTHQNLQRLLGVSVDEDGFIVFILGEVCQKGSLTDLLEKDSLKLDWSFKNSLIKDIVMGMTYLHNSVIESHGNLSSHTCLVDSRFMLKVSDYGLTMFRDPKDLLPPTEDQDEERRNFADLLWRAPEYLRQAMPVKGSQKGDVYSFGIILQQIILRSSPFDVPGDTKAYQTAKDLVMQIKQGSQPPFRPAVPVSACSSELYHLMEFCWEEYPIERPTFVKIKESLKKVIGNSGDNIIDHLLNRMEQYASDLEQQVEEKTAQFTEEKRRAEELLGQLLPKSIAESLTRGHNVEPESFDCVSIYFSDIVTFTVISAAGTPMDVVSMLNNLYTMFDAILEKFSAYKVETIGDAYMVASGLPVRNGNRHAYEIALVSLTIRKELNDFRIPHLPTDKLKLRIGMHSGPCVAGIVGLKMPRYCLFGDTVVIAQKMESSGEAMRIQVTQAAKELLEDIGGFQLTEREKPVLFRGQDLRTFWLVSGALREHFNTITHFNFQNALYLQIRRH